MRTIHNNKMSLTLCTLIKLIHTMHKNLFKTVEVQQYLKTCIYTNNT
jgi:hypothetical protein